MHPFGAGKDDGVPWTTQMLKLRWLFLEPSAPSSVYRNKFSLKRRWRVFQPISFHRRLSHISIMRGPGQVRAFNTGFFSTLRLCAGTLSKNRSTPPVYYTDILRPDGRLPFPCV